MCEYTTNFYLSVLIGISCMHNQVRRELQYVLSLKWHIMKVQQIKFSHHISSSTSSSSSGRIPGHGSMVTATPIPLRPMGISVTSVHTLLAGQ